MLLRALAISLFLALGVFGVGCAAPVAPEGRRERSSALEDDHPSVRAYLEQLEEAEKKTKENDERLGRAFPRIAPLLTEAQQRDFARGFQALPDVQEATAAYREAASKLDRELTSALADDTLPSDLSGSQVFEAYVRLARSPSPTGALAFAMRKLKGDPKLSRVPGSTDDVVTKIVIPALPGSFLEKLITSRSKDAAVSSLATLLETSGGKCSTVVAWLEKPFVLGETENARKLLVGGKSVSQALNAVAGLIVIWDLGGDIARGDVDAALATLEKGGPTVLGGVVDATSLVRRFLVHSPKSVLDGVVKVGARLGGGIALVSSIFTLASDLDKEAWGRVAVDLVAIAGAVMALTGIGPAMPVALLAIGLGLFIDWLEEGAREEQLRRDVEASLKKTNVKAPLVGPLAKAEPYLVEQLTQELKMTPEQIQWLLSVDDLALTFDGVDRNTFDYQGLIITATIFKLDGNAMKAFLEATIAGETDPANRRAMIEDLVFMLNNTANGWNATLDKRSAVAWFDRDPAGRYYYDEDLALHQTMMKNARKFLAGR